MKQRRMAAPSLRGRNQDQAAPRLVLPGPATDPRGGSPPQPFLRGGLEQRVDQAVIERLIDRNDQDAVGPREERGQAGLDRGAFPVGVARVDDGARLPSRPERTAHERGQGLGVAPQDHDAFGDTALLDLLQLVLPSLRVQVTQRSSMLQRSRPARLPQEQLLLPVLVRLLLRMLLLPVRRLLLSLLQPFLLLLHHLVVPLWAEQMNLSV